MNKVRFSGTATPVAINEWDKKSKHLLLTRSDFIEIIINLYILQNTSQIEKTKLNSYWDYIPRNSLSNFTGDFLNNLKSLNKNASKEMLKFIYSALLIPLTFSSHKQANILKNGEFLFYLAIGKFKGQKIDFYLSSKSYNLQVLGEKNKANNEYIYISRMMHFNNSQNSSIIFDDINNALNLTLDTNIIKIHYSKINSLKTVLEKL